MRTPAPAMQSEDVLRRTALTLGAEGMLGSLEQGAVLDRPTDPGGDAVRLTGKVLGDLANGKQDRALTHLDLDEGSDGE